MRQWLNPRFWSALAMAGALVLPTTHLAAQGPTPETSGVTTGKSTGKLSFRLDALAQSSQLRAASAATQARALSLPVSGPGSLLKDSGGRLLVYVFTDDLAQANLNAIQNTGATIVHVSEQYKVVTVYVDAANLNALANLSTVQSLREELRPEVRGPGLTPQTRRTSAPAACTPKVSEGDTQLGANTARSTYSVDGTGVKVGVLSDSFDKSGLTDNWAYDVANGELPGPGNPCSRTTPVSVISETLDSSGSDEGRAMTQIVHDLAPGAQLGFASAFNGLYEFADNIRNLRAWGADIIVDDVFYYAEPLFQDGPVAVAISDVVGSGAAYFTSAGNSNIILGGKDVASYEAPAFRPATCPSTLTVAPYYSKFCHDFDPGGGTTAYDSVTLANGGSILLDFQWNEPWNGVTTDLDVFLLNSSTNAVLAWSYANNTGTGGIPYEAFYYENNTGSSQTYRIVIGRYSASGTPRIKFFLTQSTYNMTSIQWNTTGTDIIGPTISGHSASKYAMSVAAVPYNSTTTPEQFSSRGPAAHYLGPVLGSTVASTIVTETLQQPDFTATDGGLNSFFGSTGCTTCRFYGTSAAAPHAAAVGALMLQEARAYGHGLGQGSMRSLLKATAATMSGGTVNSVGSGMVYAPSAVKVTKYMVFTPVIRR